MKITDLTNNSSFIDLDLEEAGNVIGGRGYSRALEYYRRTIHRKRSLGRVEADDTPTVKLVATGGSVSTDSDRAPIIRGPLYY